MKTEAIAQKLEQACRDFTQWDKPEPGVYNLNVGPYALRVASIGGLFRYTVNHTGNDEAVAAMVNYVSALDARAAACAAALHHLDQQQ